MELNNNKEPNETDKLITDTVNSETPQYPIDDKSLPTGTLISSYYNITNAMSQII